MLNRRTLLSTAALASVPLALPQGALAQSRFALEESATLLREARQFNAREFRILAHPKVVDLFLEEESQALAMLGDFIGKPITLQAEGSFRQEQYDIVLS